MVISVVSNPMCEMTSEVLPGLTLRKVKLPSLPVSVTVESFLMTTVAPCSGSFVCLSKTLPEITTGFCENKTEPKIIDDSNNDNFLMEKN